MSAHLDAAATAGYSSSTPLEGRYAALIVVDGNLLREIRVRESLAPLMKRGEILKCAAQ